MIERKPVVLVVMDGVGLSETTLGNAVANAYKPTFDWLSKNCAYTEINAHGTYVGLPSDDDMGNSEVGHNAIGCGQVYSQGAKLVNESIASKAIYNTDVWKDTVDYVKDSTLHFIGLLSDGNVHSHINHLLDLVKNAKLSGIKRVRIHTLLDGRDVPETSGLIYIKQLEDLLAELNDDTFDGKIASGGGRMYITMDRYEAEWDMVKRGWYAHVLGEGRTFASASEAIETYREELNCSDQNLPEFVIIEDGKPVGTIEDHDAVILFNFRGDRALELTRAFEAKQFDKFDRKRYPEVRYVGMLQYDGDLKIPELFLVQPPRIKNTLSETLVAKGLNQYAISETQKFGHVTYFWNGNRSEKFDNELETWVEIKSDLVPFDERPWMKAAEITDNLIEAIKSKKYDFLRANFPNGDMVGHTGNYQATLISVEAVDLMLTRLVEVAKKENVTLIVTADHGNADEMYEKRKDENEPLRPKTSHTLNKVPFIVYNNDVCLKRGDYGLSNIAATVAQLFDVKPHPDWNESLIDNTKKD